MENLMIQLELGKFYPNRTARYLFPILNTYSNEFLIQFGHVKPSLMCTAIGDVKYNMAKKEEVKYALFLIFDINGMYDLGLNRYISEVGGQRVFNQFLSYVRQYKHFLDDYRFDSMRGHKHCIVLSLPKQFQKSYDYFLESVYSKMYTEEELKKVKINKTVGNVPSHIWAVLTHDPGYKVVFEEKLNSFFGTHVAIEDDREYDLPVTLEDEILNFEDSGLDS